MTTAATTPSPKARWIRVLIDLGGLVVALVAVTVLKGLVLVGILGMDPRDIPMDDARVYGVEYLTPVVLLPALTWLLRRRGESWGGLGLRRPRSWSRFAGAVGATTGAALLLNLILRWLPTLWNGAWPPSELEALAGNTEALLVIGVYTVLLVGLTEELVFRGFLMSRLALAFGGEEGAWLLAAVLTGLLFGAIHFQHGLLSVLNASVLGVLFGFAYLRFGRNLWVVVAAHSLYDTVRAVQYFLS